MRRRTFIELMQRDIQEYRESGQSWPARRIDIAQWLIDNGKYDKSRESLLKMCARDVSRALREEFYTDPQDRRVRAKHAARIPVKNADGSIEQMTFWGDQRTEPREFMERAFMQHRRQIVGECTSLSFCVDSYNDNVCPDNPIQLPLDFTDDVAENKQSGEVSFDRTQADEDDDSIELELPSERSPRGASRSTSGREPPRPSDRPIDLEQLLRGSSPPQ
jgi:hypothetical protein